MNRALHALNRFGLGARVGERDRLGDPREWLLAQLHPAKAHLTRHDLPKMGEIAAAVAHLTKSIADKDDDRAKEARRAIGEIAAKEALASLEQRIRTEAPFVERLVAFWSNHLCISTADGKQPVVALAGHYEREVIRPHALGRFSDMVLASARHPTMLLYLDNAQSVGPNSPAARRAGRKRDINENYARELMELHTVGVGGGYAQEDVRQLAMILTGWTVVGLRTHREKQPPGFIFRPPLHEPGGKTVLGRIYKESGVAEGEQAIRDLCHHDKTAAFLATKLVRHFVADDPPPRAVAQIAGVFRETKGDLKAVAGALVGLGEAWDPAHRKFLTPQDWLVAALRALEIRDAQPRLLRTLNRLRHGWWSPLSPKGYGDTLGDWSDPDGLMKRAELARSIARATKGKRVDPAGLVECVQLGDSDPLPRLLHDNDITRDERVALALAGPAFQWR